MANIVGDIRTNITLVEGEIAHLRKIAKRNIDNPEKVREITVELRAQVTKLRDLQHNLSVAETPSSIPASIPA
jgi:hypothetical protein